MAKFKTREEWLHQGIILCTELFNEIRQKVPKDLKVSCGFPAHAAFARKKQRIGECWYPQKKGDPHQLFISPIADDPVKVLDILVHEMIHPIAGVKSGHHGQFKRIALEVGLTGKMTATVATPELKARLTRFAKALGPYPHVSLTKMTNGRKKEGTRLLKAQCPKCGYPIRVTRKWIDEVGLPICPCGFEMEEA